MTCSCSSTVFPFFLSPPHCIWPSFAYRARICVTASQSNYVFNKGPLPGSGAFVRTFLGSEKLPPWSTNSHIVDLPLTSLIRLQHWVSAAINRIAALGLLSALWPKAQRANILRLPAKRAIKGVPSPPIFLSLSITTLFLSLIVCCSHTLPPSPRNVHAVKRDERA